MSYRSAVQAHSLYSLLKHHVVLKAFPSVGRVRFGLGDLGDSKNLTLTSCRHPFPSPLKKSL